jgi:hypothetical protein
MPCSPLSEYLRSVCILYQDYDGVLTFHTPPPEILSEAERHFDDGNSRHVPLLVLLLNMFITDGSAS